MTRLCLCPPHAHAHVHVALSTKLCISVHLIHTVSMSISGPCLEQLLHLSRAMSCHCTHVQTRICVCLSVHPSITFQPLLWSTQQQGHLHLSLPH